MSSKKQKKQKGKTLSLQEFAASLEPTTAGQNVIYAPKVKQSMPMSWADEAEQDDFDYTERVKIILPSAPRAARGPDFDETKIPHDPPFVVHIGNVAFNIDEGDIYDFFKDMEITDLRLPRDQDNRLRGFGYVYFKTRENLIDALCMNELVLNGRPLRISPGQGDGGDRRGGGGRGNVDMTPDDWRSAPKQDLGPPRPEFRRPEYGNSDFGPRGGSDFGRRGYGSRGDFDGDRRNYGPPRDEDFSRSDFGTEQHRGGGSGGFGRRGNYRDEYLGGEADEEGTWRRNPPVGPRNDDENRRYGNQNRGRDGSPFFGDARGHPERPRTQSPEFVRSRYIDPPSRSSKEEEGVEQEQTVKPQPPRERKKLVIAPRTVKESADTAPVSNSAIFGGARPVDTAAREREIEKKLSELEEPRRIRILMRPNPEGKEVASPSEAPSYDKIPTATTGRPFATENGIYSTSDTKTSESSSTSPTPPRKPEPGPPPAPVNAWAERRDWKESRQPRETSLHNRNEDTPPVPPVSNVEYDEDEQHTREVDRLDSHSPHPDSDHKDTNSEPEDERDLRLQQEEDDFQRVERRGRKPKPAAAPPTETNNRARGEFGRGRGAGARGGLRRGSAH